MDGGENETLTQTRTPTTRKSLLDDLAQNPDSERLDEFVHFLIKKRCNMLRIFVIAYLHLFLCVNYYIGQ